VISWAEHPLIIVRSAHCNSAHVHPGVSSACWRGAGATVAGVRGGERRDRCEHAGRLSSMLGPSLLCDGSKSKQLYLGGVLAAVLETRLRKEKRESLAPIEFVETAPLPIIDGLGMRKLPITTVEELLEIMMRRCECASNVEGTSKFESGSWFQLLGFVGG